MNYRIDLHTHSCQSYDGGISRSQYHSLFSKKILDVVAVTDHNKISFAQEMQGLLGDKIIVGEEITTLQGEVIGLFLKKVIPPRLSLKETVNLIRKQQGLVYIPHPFEVVRHGIKKEHLQKITAEIDIIEVFNARSKFRGAGNKALKFARSHNIPMAASSDAHCFMGVGTSYTLISSAPESPNALSKILHNAQLHQQYAPLISYLCPAINKIKKQFKDL